MSGFPGPYFGYCERCGGDGGDYPASLLTGADSQGSLDTAIKKTVLKKYRGKLLCPKCVIDQKDEDWGKEEARKHSADDRKRARLGFTGTVED